MMIYKLSTATDPIVAKISVLVNMAGPHVLDAALALALGTALLFNPQTQETTSEEPYISRVNAVENQVSEPILP